MADRRADRPGRVGRGRLPGRPGAVRPMRRHRNILTEEWRIVAVAAAFAAVAMVYVALQVIW